MKNELYVNFLQTGVPRGQQAEVSHWEDSNEMNEMLGERRSAFKTDL
jgi:hypothetical protein